MTDKKDATSRRDFLKVAATAAPAALVAATAGTEAAAGPALADLSRDTMQDTAHTRAYFDSARF